MNGLDAARRIRQNQQCQSIPIIAMTARVLPEAREQCLQSDCNDYISKPFSPKQLLSRIQKLLPKHEAATGKTSNPITQP
jgi:CheY-like chemotaxis protein